MTNIMFLRKAHRLVELGKPTVFNRVEFLGLLISNRKKLITIVWKFHVTVYKKNYIFSWWFYFICGLYAELSCPIFYCCYCDFFLCKFYLLLGIFLLFLNKQLWNFTVRWITSHWNLMFCANELTSNYSDSFLFFSWNYVS